MATQKTEQKCYVHDKVRDWDDVADVRKNVCVNDQPLTKHTDGNHYCLFHLPTKDKDIAKFEEIFQARLDAAEKKVAEIEKWKSKYDFRYVWFPSNVYLGGDKSAVDADFRSATFAAVADFRSANFAANADFRSANFAAAAGFRSANFAAAASFNSATFAADADFSSATFVVAYFSSATFSADASFSLATFAANAYFSSATFAAEGDFRTATFAAEADFSSATFAAEANFSSATFVAEANFSLAKILETSQVFFRRTNFCRTVNLNETVFAGYVTFEGKKGKKDEKDEKDEYVFLNKKAVLEVKKELNEKFKNLQKELAERGINFQIPDKFEVNQEVVLDLQNARIDDAKKISFHTVRLEPSWFINTDATELVFTDCKWRHADGKRQSAKREIENLKNRGFERPNALLTKACWQLADNHEEAKSFAKSSMFRQIANESRRLERPWYRQPFTMRWWYYRVSNYGEDWRRAFYMLLGILVLCGVFYNSPFAYFELTEKKEKTENVIVINDPAKPKLPEYYEMNNPEGFIYSLYVAAIQRPEPKPAADSNLTKAFVILETIFAPLQAALLALAIRRKFMR